MDNLKRILKAIFITALIICAILGGLWQLISSMGIPERNKAVKQAFQEGKTLSCRYRKDLEPVFLSKENAAFDRGVFFLKTQETLKRVTYTFGDCKIVK